MPGVGERWDDPGGWQEMREVESGARPETCTPSRWCRLMVALLDHVEYELGRHLGRLRLGSRHLRRWLLERGLEEIRRGDGS